MPRRVRLVAFAALLSLLSAACSSGGDDNETVDPAPAGADDGAVDGSDDPGRDAPSDPAGDADDDAPAATASGFVTECPGVAEVSTALGITLSEVRELRAAADGLGCGYRSPDAPLEDIFTVDLGSAAEGSEGQEFPGIGDANASTGDGSVFVVVGDTELFATIDPDFLVDDDKLFAAAALFLA